MKKFFFILVMFVVLGLAGCGGRSGYGSGLDYAVYVIDNLQPGDGVVSIPALKGANIVGFSTAYVIRTDEKSAVFNGILAEDIMVAAPAVTIDVLRGDVFVVVPRGYEVWESGEVVGLLLTVWFGGPPDGVVSLVRE